ncbi:MAG TPA: DUF6159 family protein [Thermoleophilaceae bacterium]|jgi:hypothetical protein
MTARPPDAHDPPSSGGARHKRGSLLESLVDGWRLGGAAIGFVLGSRPLKRFLLGSLSAAVLLSAGVAVAAVALRRHGGPVEYALAGFAASYFLSLVVTAVAVGVASMVADGLDGRPLRPADGWQRMRSRRRAIAGWALIDATVGVPSKYVGSWTIDQFGALVLGFGWSLLSFFAIPAIALTGASTWQSARGSLRLMRGRWGDAVYSIVYLWVRAVVVFGLPAAASLAIGVLLIRHGKVFIGGALFAAGAAGLVLAFVLAQAARTVITVVLYKYADSGTVYPAFPAELLNRSLRGPSNTFQRVAQRLEGKRLQRLRRKALDLIERPDRD